MNMKTKLFVLTILAVGGIVLWATPAPEDFDAILARCGKQVYQIHTDRVTVGPAAKDPVGQAAGPQHIGAVHSTIRPQQPVPTPAK